MNELETEATEQYEADRALVHAGSSRKILGHLQELPGASGRDGCSGRPGTFSDGFNP